MLQIKNTLGGGGAKGLYAWSKNQLKDRYIYLKAMQSGNISISYSSTGLTYYYSEEFTVSEDGKFVLTNPSSGYGGVNGNLYMEPGYYYIASASSGTNVYYAESVGDGTSYFWGNNNGAYMTVASSDTVYVLSSPKIVKDKIVIDYVLSNNESKYPDGDTHTDGYYYEKVDKVKMSYGSMSNAGNTSAGNLTIEHGLGVKPDLFIVYKANRSHTTSNYYGQMYLHLSNKLSSFNIGGSDLYDIMSYFYSSWDVLGSASEYVDENEFVYPWTGSDSSSSKPFYGAFGWVAIAF